MASFDRYASCEFGRMYPTPRIRFFPGRVSSVDYMVVIKLMFSADVGASGGYVLFISVLSFLLWYRPIYLGFTRSEGRAMAFFFCKLHPPPHMASADDRYLLPICRFPPLILDLHGHRYPMYVTPKSMSEGANQ
jgi:hypothetical protein